MDNFEYDEILFQLTEIEESKNIDNYDKIRLLQANFYNSLDLFISENKIFSSLITKILFIAEKFGFSEVFTQNIFHFRRAYELKAINDEKLHLYIRLGLYVNYNLVYHLLNRHDLLKDLSTEDQSHFAGPTLQQIDFYQKLEGVILGVDFIENTARFYNTHTNEEQVIQIDVAGQNELFTQNLKMANRVLDYPYDVNLIDVKVTEDHRLVPAVIVVNPDYLVDVTAICHSTTDNAGAQWLHALSKLNQSKSSMHILIGNIVNHLFDALIYDPQYDFNNLFFQYFKEEPIKWLTYNDHDLESISLKLKQHFKNLKKCVVHDFEQKNIDKSHVYLEPSFYCRDYGIQGRLDLFHYNKSKGKSDIVELKSSKLFKSNKYGINPPHYLQTLLYDLIIKSAYKNKINPINYILYSVLEEDSLRQAPISTIEQTMLIKIRNEIMLIEYGMAMSTEKVAKTLNYLKSSNFGELSGFEKKELKEFEEIYSSLDGPSKAYYITYCHFVCKEHILSKTGEAGGEKAKGLASLWLDTIEEKQERFSILSHLEITENNSDQALPLIYFQYSEYGKNQRLSNFRVGDAVVIYPHNYNPRDILHHQIFKSTIIDIDSDRIVVRLRNTQRNQEIFRETDFWNIESDVVDSSFKHYFKNLFLFIASDIVTRELIIGKKAPELYTIDHHYPLSDELSNEQKNIILKMFHCKDYFLLWGPPGTGKTSMIIKHYVKLLHNNTSEKILLLAYTNKAVDEICRAIIEGGLQENMIRIGSSFSVAEDQKKLLLNHKIEGFKKRKEILAYLEQNRIYVSTISSMMGKLTLLDVIQFDTVIVDEASQILEPMLCGLLTQFKKFILIGDHKQLPAVVTQSEKSSAIMYDELQKMQFSNARTSLFERLYIRCQDQKWDMSHSILCYQGRMHQHIMQFVSNQFYEGKLLIHNTPRLHKPAIYDHHIENRSLIATSRMIYIPTEIDISINYKTNKNEAEAVLKSIQEILKLYQDQGKKVHENSIGVITPYRAQIALIKHYLRDIKEPILVDTVERYQGGAKDHIIISLCTNRLSQLHAISNLSEDGVDRKLNVALTRAKDQCIIIGNEEILKSSSNYRQLIEYCTK